MNDFMDMGPGGAVALKRIVASGRFDSAPIRRSVHQARKEGRLIDLTYGRACKWVFFLDSGHVVLAATSELNSEESERKV
jgi:regulator of extracellular matrix RemA (YlzA/DUF370 family)